MLIPIVVVLVASTLSIILAYLTMVEKDLLIATIYIAFIGVLYTLIYYILMAPDVVLAYMPVSSILLPLMIVIVLKKTKRFEE
ncbi:MAG: hydrogenase subunit MbhD domain-containing protein [Sulfolobales archaeon]